MVFSKILHTDRLVLGPIDLRDSPFFFRLLGDAEVRRYLGGPVPWRRRLRQFSAYRQGAPHVGIWIVRPRGRRQALGLIVLSPHKDGAEYEVSYQFRPTAWGQGFAREATARVVAHAFSDTGLQRVIAETQAANAASCTLLKRLGFTEDRRLTRFGALQVLYARSAGAGDA